MGGLCGAAGRVSTSRAARLLPRLVIIGGGISKKYEKFLPLLTVDYPVVPAGLRNEAGIIGAAIAVAEGWSN